MKSKKKQLFRNLTQTVTAIAVIVTVAFIGVHLLVSSHAQSPYIYINTDTGTLTTPAAVLPCTSSSDGKCVQFGSVQNGTPISPSNVTMPAIPSGWHAVFSSTFSTPEAFGSVSGNGFPGWHGPYCYGNADSSNQIHQGSGIWQCSQTVTVGPNKSGDGTAVPANVLDIWQHVQNGVPVSAVLMPNCSGTAGNGCTTVPYGGCDTSYGSGCEAMYGLTSECVSFEFRVTPYPSPGWKMVPLLWVDTPAQTKAGIHSEVDSPEVDFGYDYVSSAVHFPSGNYIDALLDVNTNGTYSATTDWSVGKTMSNINLNNWTEWETCRTPGQLQVSIDGEVAWTIMTGQMYDQWGTPSGTVEVPTDAMHWVLQTETTTNGDHGEAQPTGNDADHVQFNWVQITAPN